MAQRGRPPGSGSKYTPELGAEICRRLAAGESLRAVCRTEGMPSADAVLDWVEAYPEFGRQYTRDRLTGYKLLADELVDIADDGTNDYVDKEPDGGKIIRVLDNEHVQRSRLRLDTRKWLLSKMLPKVYGDRLELAGEVDIGVSARIVAARKRTQKPPEPEDDGSDLV